LVFDQNNNKEEKPMARETSKPHHEGGNQGFFVDPEALARLVEISVQKVLEEQFEQHIAAKPYERTKSRRGYRNGRKGRTMKTALGELQFQVPQAREGGFRPTVFERYQRSDRALVAAMQEMVVQGVSTRRVSAVLEEMAGFEVSGATVSRAMAELDEEIERFRTRSLKGHVYPYVVIDARYEHVRENGRVVNEAVLIAAGITEQGRREILGYWLGETENEQTWSQVFRDLKKRALEGVRVIISDAHKGIIAALETHYPKVQWQRCRVHFIRELMNKVARTDRFEIANDIQSIFTSDEKEYCLRVAEEIAVKWESRRPSVSKAIRQGIEPCLTVQPLARNVRRRIHSTNMLERLMREIKRRTRVVSIFPNGASCVRLIGALLIEIHETWVTEEKRYINLDGVL
jgi:transposase-like protein